jgi:Carboxypeptidase regulatory-like domain
MRNLSRLALVALLALATMPASLWGQASNGTSTITGAVTDASGAVVPGATVTITDTSTKISKTFTTNAAGLYVYSNVNPGTYDITVQKEGFKQSAISAQQVIVGQTLTANVTLEVGAATQTVEVTATPGAQLQTLNATMGSSLSGSTILQLPSINRDASSLLSYQATSAPNFNGAEGNIMSGGVAGQTSDQNTYLLDGGNNTDDLAGDSGYVNGFGGAGRGAVPTPIESIQEFQVNTNNTTSDFATSAGAQILLVTKRGTNQWHGSGYDYLQSSVLNSNDWYNNLTATSKPKTHSNRFGGSIGGPVAPKFLGGKTYLYVNYEGNRYPRSGPYARTVPSDLLRQGILQFRDATGNVVQYNLATSTQCGIKGGVACDPRGIGLNPVVSQVWSTYEPEPNDCVTGGDHLNTCAYRSNLSYPLSDNFAVGRLDHDFGSNWRFMASYRIYKENNPTTNQTDVGGLLAGDTKGQIVSAANNVLQPRYLVVGLTGTLTPTLTNDFHMNYTRNFWQWFRAGAAPQISGIPGSLGIGGESTSALIPINIDTQNARSRLWNGHDWDFRDTVSWLKGNHFFQIGGEDLHQWMHFDRYDNVVGGLTQLVYDVNNTGVQSDPNFEPIPCSDTVMSNCLPADHLGSWKSLLAQSLGIVDAARIVATRTGANLSLQPLGQPVHSYDLLDTYDLFFSDAWKVKPNLTLSYGLNWGTEMPPYEQYGEHDILTTADGASFTIEQYLASVQQNAQNGQIYNPSIAWTPIGRLGNKYPYQPFYGGFAPRVSLAWSPSWDSGFMGKWFGHKSTVLRGGYARIYGKQQAINFISDTVLGDGFLQPVTCQNPNMSGACAGTNNVTPANAFRIGVDGNSVPLDIAPTLQSPVVPGVNAPYATLTASLSPNFRPESSDQFDLSLQRQLPGNAILEVGYLGIWTKHLYQGIDLGNVPWMMKQGGQSFAQAYYGLAQELINGKSVTSQPFFETALAGSSYCKGYSSCTAAVAANESGNITTQSVTNLWSDLEGSWTAFGPALTSTNQCFYCYDASSDGISNYQAGIVNLQKRSANGLTLDANFTYSHALGTFALSQTYTLANVTDPWNVHVDYGPQYYDRKFVFNMLGTYQLPFGPGKHWSSSNGVVSRLIGGWAISPVFEYASGSPLPVYDGSFQEWGQAFDGNAVGAVPLVNTASLSNSPHLGVTSDGNVGVNADGFSNANLFGSNATQVFNSFRPNFLGLDGRSMGTGNLRGQSRWNLDLGLTKDTRITERVGAQLFVQAFNVLNHMQWGDPYNNLQDPGDFGALEGQYGVLNSNYTRVIQAGLRIAF